MEDLLMHIGEVYDGGTWERLTGKIWNDGSGYDLWKFEQDVDYDGRTYRCIIIKKRMYLEEFPEDVDDAINVFVDAFPL